MRRFRDRQGGEWDVVLGRESWGAQVALFVPRDAAAHPVRQAMLSAVAYDKGMSELDALDEHGLQALFDRSTIKDQETA